jgi:hypothetical protein
VSFNNGTADGESHSQSLGFCRKEWIEDMLDIFRSHTGPGIFHLDENGVAVLRRADMKNPVAIVCRSHGVDRVPLSMCAFPVTR